MKLGIDFGTSYCTLSRRNTRSGLPEPVPDENDGTKIPSLVFWGAAEIKVGQAAEELFHDSLLMTENEREEILLRLIRSVKRNFSEDTRIYLPDGKSISAREVAAEIFKYLKRTAENGCAVPEIRELCLTHPVSFSEAQKVLLRSAAGDAGFRDIQLLPEPIAAVKGFLASENHLGENILVFDLGGGTLDLSFVHKDSARGYHLPVVPLGRADCGGDDFDQLLYDYLEKRYLEKREPGFSDDPDLVDLAVLRQCRLAKEKLSRNEEIAFKATARHSIIKLCRDQFERVISAPVSECMTLTRQMLRNIGNAGYQVDTVLLIGGSCRIPCLRRELEKLLPVKPLQTMYADTAVALGAVADILVTRDTSNRSTDRIVAPPPAADRSPASAAAGMRSPGASAPAAAGMRQEPLRQKEDPRESVEEQFRRGRYLLYGIGVPKNEAAALEWLRKAAERNHAGAQYLLGKCYLYGQGVKEDDSAALKWLQLAAKQNHPDAQYQLGLCFYYGWGVKEDESTALQLFRSAAEQGNDDAQCMLGKCYLYGQGVKEDDSVALKWLQLAAKQDHPEAQYQLGLCFYYGWGVKEDESTAFQLFRSAAERGNADAQCMLGKCYLYGLGVKENYSVALKWLQLAAKQDLPEAQYQLGLCFNFGWGAVKCENMAFQLFRRAAEQGNADAQCMLGKCYLYGQGVKEDNSAAVKWFQLAAEQDHSKAQYQLGLCFYHGWGVREDKQTALKWFSLAAEQGDEEAREKLETCYGR